MTATGGRYVTSPAGDPLGRPIAARWGALGDGETAVIEVSAASGLSLLSMAERDPTITTTRGTGDLIRAALDAGYTRILIGLGDSATNDAGVGMAQALGVRALDDMGRDLPNGGAALMRLHSLELEDVHPRLASARITALCDVTNPLCGPGGASAVFGPQKGATLGRYRCWTPPWAVSPRWPQSKWGAMCGTSQEREPQEGWERDLWHSAALRYAPASRSSAGRRVWQRRLVEQTSS